MKSRFLILAVPVLASCANWSDDIAGPSVSANANLAASATMQGGLVDRYIVVFNDDVQNPAALSDEIARGAGATVHFRYTSAIKGFAATIPAAALEGVSRNPNVAYVEPDGIATVSGAGSDNTVGSWGLDRIDDRQGLDGSYTWNQDGSGVHAYILDTGIRKTHQQFTGRISADYFDAIGGTGEDCHGHGTHVAGTVGGSEYGVARSVTLVAVRVLNCAGSGTYSGIIAGVDWVKNHASGSGVGAAVANMSLGGGVSSSLNTAVNNAVSSGVVFAVAAGNENTDACSRSPASAANALTVGATGSNDARASFSNYGTCVDIFAPGVSITSAYKTSDTAIAGMSGTSMASPHVAGVAALYLSGNGSATAAQVEAALEESATPNLVTSAGAGSPNLLLYSLLTPPAGGNNPPTASFTYSCTYLDCTFNASASSDGDGNIQSYAWTFGDGSNGSGVNPSHTYASSGTRTVTLTVTDNGGASGSTSQQVPVTAPPSGVISLAANGYKVKGLQKADLSWNGAIGPVNVLRNGIVRTTTSASMYTDHINVKGGGSYSYQVCETTGALRCSNVANVTF